MTRSKVSIIPLASYDDQAAVDQAVQDALAPFGGMAHFVSAGQKVLLKPNFVAPAKPEMAVTTHPAVARAVVRAVNACGGTCLIGDGPGVSNASAVARSCGIQEVADAEHATVTDFEETALFENMDNTVAPHLELAKQVKDCDVLITLPKLKTHVLMSMTCALKNQYGLMPGVAKAKYHFRFQNTEKFADLIIDINRSAHPALAIVDAVVAMEGNGPSGGTPRQVGVIIAGDDLAAVDTVAATLINLPLEKLPILMAARRANFGATDLSDIDIVGARLEDFIVSDFKQVKAPANLMRILPLPVPVLKWLRRQLVPKPHIDVTKCIKCGRCHNGCPVTPPAIDPLHKGGPVFNDKTCIRCYCCHEFCPVKAIDLKKSFLDKYFHIVAVSTFCHAVFGKIAAFIRK